LLADGIYPAGSNSVQFNAGQAGGSTVYFYRILTEYGSTTGKMILLK
jgi:hypothetical protein